MWFELNFKALREDVGSGLSISQDFYGIRPLKESIILLLNQ